MAGIILTAAGLGFLGLGAQPPLPEWGADDLLRAASSSSTSGGSRPCPASRSSSSRSASTCSATACATCSTRGAAAAVSLLEVEDLRVTFPTETGPVEAVRGVSFSLDRERLAIVGESGSRQDDDRPRHPAPDPRRPRSPRRRIAFDGIDLLAASDRADARAARPPHHHGDAGPEVLAEPGDARRRPAHRGPAPPRGHGPRARRARKAIEMLEAVQIRDPERVFDAYPHELSGGMGQRVMIAMMLIPEPDLLIADEPTSALDVTVQAEVLRILDGLVRERGLGLIFISHDLQLVSRFCDRVIVMYRGRIVEELAAARPRRGAASLHPRPPQLPAEDRRHARARCRRSTATRPGRSEPMALIEIDHLSVTFRQGGARGARGARRLLRRRAARVLRPRRRVGLGQVDHPARHLRPRAGHRRRDPHRRPPRAAAARRGLRPPGADGVPGPLRLAAPEAHRRRDPRRAARHPRHPRPRRPRARGARRRRPRPARSASATRTSSPAASASASPSPGR